MKNSIKYFGLIMLAVFGFQAQAQGILQDVDNWRPYDQRGINMFEAPKDTMMRLKKLKPAPIILIK